MSGNSAAWIFPYGKSGNVNSLQRNYTLKVNNNFGVTSDGTLIAKNANISGDVSATSFSLRDIANIDSLGNYMFGRTAN